MDALDELTDALLDLIETKNDRNKAMADCDGSWGYYGHEYEEDLRKAKERFAAALKAVLLGDL